MVDMVAQQVYARHARRLPLTAEEGRTEGSVVEPLSFSFVRRTNMKSAAPILAVIGAVLVVLGIVNHFVKNFANFGHASIVIGAVGLVLLVAGGAMMMMGRSASA